MFTLLLSDVARPIYFSTIQEVAERVARLTDTEHRSKLWRVECAPGTKMTGSDALTFCALNEQWGEYELKQVDAFGKSETAGPFGLGLIQHDEQFPEAGDTFYFEMRTWRVRSVLRTESASGRRVLSIEDADPRRPPKPRFKFVVQRRHLTCGKCFDPSAHYTTYFLCGSCHEKNFYCIPCLEKGVSHCCGKAMKAAVNLLSDCSDELQVLTCSCPRKF